MPAGWLGSVGVVCESPSFCLSIDGHGRNAATWDGSEWSNAGQLGQGRFNEFDCASPSYCVAGSVSDGTTRIWDGADWTAGPDLGISPTSISCPAVDDCWAGTEEGSATHFDGSTWSPVQQVAVRGVGNVNDLTIRCPTTTRCLAGDELGNVYFYDGGTWGGRVQVGPVLALDCGSATSCTVALGLGRHDDLVGKVARWRGDGWTRSRALPRGYDNLPRTLSCPSRATCFLVDQSGNSWVRH